MVNDSMPRKISGAPLGESKSFRGPHLGGPKYLPITSSMQLNCTESHAIVFWSRRLREKVDQPEPLCSGIEKLVN